MYQGLLQSLDRLPGPATVPRIVCNTYRPAVTLARRLRIWLSARREKNPFGLRLSLAEERDVNEFRYSNYLEIGQNPFEFVLQFGQQYDDDGKKTLIHIRIVTSPAYAKHFAELLREAVDYYEEHHGTVPNA